MRRAWPRLSALGSGLGTWLAKKVTRPRLLTVLALAFTVWLGLLTVLDRAWGGWNWAGWIALGAVGTVGALLVLGYKAWLQRSQSLAEAAQRRQDEGRRREDFQFEHTPLLSAVGTANVNLHGQQNVTVHLGLDAAGEGVAYNVIANLFGLDNGLPSGALGQPVVVPQMRSPAQEPLTYTYSLADLPHHPPLRLALPHQVQLEVGFFNMFGQRIVFTHTCRVSAQGLTITDPPSFTWPWEFAGR